MARDAVHPRRLHANAVSSWLHWLTGDINPVLMTVAIVAGMLFAALTVLVIAHPAPFFFDRPIEVAVQSVNVGPFAWFNGFVSAFSGFVGVGVGAAVIVATFLFRRPATPFVAFSAIYAAVYNIVNIIVLPAAADGRGTHHLKPVGLQLPKRARGILCLAEHPRHGAPRSQPAALDPSTSRAGCWRASSWPPQR